MNICENKWCMGLLGLLFSGVTESDTSIWKVTKDNRHLYLGGTVHVLSSADYPLPAPYESVYRDSQRLIFETDMRKLQSLEFQQVMLQSLTYREGKTLADVLSAQTYRKLQAYCDSRGIPLASIESFKPGLLTTVMLLTELQRLGISGIGVDEFMHSKTQQDGKPVGNLETVEEQLGFLEQMGRGKEDELIEYTLRDISDLKPLMNSLKAAWRSGDMPELERVALDPYIEDFPDTLNNLLRDRNEKWMPEIEAMLESEEVEFILVGVLHLVGNQGLLAQLKSRGYALEQY